MSENKTRPSTNDVATFLEAVDDDAKCADAHRVSELMGSISGEPPVMWGSSIVGFGTYHYRYATGREGDAPAVGFSPRKTALSDIIRVSLETAARFNVEFQALGHGPCFSLSGAPRTPRPIVSRRAYKERAWTPGNRN